MFVLLVPVVLIAAVVAWAAGVPGRKVLTWAGAATGGLVALSVLSLVLIIGLERDDDPEEATPPAEEKEQPVTVRPVDLELTPDDADEPFPAPGPTLDRLDERDTRLVLLRHEHASSLHQCPADDVSPDACTAGIPLAGDPRGDRLALVELRSTFRSGGEVVDCRRTRCVLAAFISAGEPVVTVPLVFGEAVTRPTVSAPTEPVVAGERVTVRLGALPGGATGAVTLCVPSDVGGPPRCGSPAPQVRFRADRDGTAVVQLPVRPTAVAGSSHRCERRQPCAIGVTGLAVATPFAPVRFLGPAGPDLSPARTATGLGVAGLLLLGSLTLVRRTDWAPPGGDPFAGVDISGDPFAGIDVEDIDW